MNLTESIRREVNALSILCKRINSFKNFLFSHSLGSFFTQPAQKTLTSCGIAEATKRLKKEYFSVKQYFLRQYHKIFLWKIWMNLFIVILLTHTKIINEELIKSD